MDVFRRYEACSLCVFCMQFFDVNFTDYLAYHKVPSGPPWPVAQARD